MSSQVMEGDRTRTEGVQSRCQAVTRAGTPCKNYARAGSAYCRVHQAAADAGRLESNQRASLEAEERELRRQLAAEVDRLVRRLEEETPEYEPPAFSAHRLMTLVEQGLAKLPKSLRVDLLKRLQKTLREDLFDLDFWKGLWYILNHTIRYNADIARRHYTGEFETDQWGLDRELLGVMQPFLSFLYKVYWRVETAGIDHVPVQGRALLVSNHSGQLPWDATMLATAVLAEHPAGRLVRTLYAPGLGSVPFFSSLFVQLGQVPATQDNGVRLLEEDELVAVFPEGEKGAGKLFRERYRLTRFGDGDFVRMALSTGSPIIPVAVVGAEETYITLARSRTMGRFTGLPSLPITPAFPWLGLFGLVPLPTKWYIDFGEPIAMDGYGPDAALNLVLVAQLADRVHTVIQGMVNDRLAQRRSVFLG
jgi:1-acyl-sn-glycerol-3-phosphate acyltransferase